jgi:hypothetical protein
MKPLKKMSLAGLDKYKSIQFLFENYNKLENIKMYYNNKSDYKY